MAVEVQEKYLDGTIRVSRGVRFKNVSQKPVRLSVPRESQVKIGIHESGPWAGKPKYANRDYEINVQPGEILAVPEEVANALQKHWCVLCSKDWRFAQHGAARVPHTVCIDTSHPRVIRSGLAPGILGVVGDDDRVIPPTLESNLVAVAETAVDADAIHQRVMARIGVGK